ncbi:MAG: YraN family protein [Candidatus Omnitrophota bacterium]
MAELRPFKLPTGVRGEMIGWHYLRHAGFRILEKNYRCVIGEIDVVAEKKGRLCFIEIKTRTGERFGRPEEAVTAAKQAKLIRLAEWYLKEHPRRDPKIAFHVLAVRMQGAAEPQIRLFEDAFQATEESA